MLTCSKVIFVSEPKEWTYSFTLDLYTSKQEAEEFKKKIVEGMPLAIETGKVYYSFNKTEKKYSSFVKRYKYIIEEIYSCEVDEGVLTIKFNGKVYNDGKLCANSEGPNLYYTTEAPYSVFCKFKYKSEAEEITSPVVSSSSSNEGQIPIHEPQANTNRNTSIYYYLGLLCAGCLAMAGGAVLCSTDRPDIGGILIASAIACLLIVGIAKLCEKVSEKKQKDPDMSTCAAVKTVFRDACCCVGLSAKASGKN